MLIASSSEEIAFIVATQLNRKLHYWISQFQYYIYIYISCVVCERRKLINFIVKGQK